jgi:hypothetical protein
VLTLLQHESICYSKNETPLEWVGPLLLMSSEVRRIPDGIPGVYLLHALAKGLGGYATFYVGKSLDLRRRLSQHLGERTTKPLISAARELQDSYWSAAPVLDSAKLAAIEGGLIRALRPVCNWQTPSADPIAVNLPPLLLLTTFTEESITDDY